MSTPLPSVSVSGPGVLRSRTFLSQTRQHFTSSPAESSHCHLSVFPRGLSCPTCSKHPTGQRTATCFLGSLYTHAYMHKDVHTYTSFFFKGKNTGGRFFRVHAVWIQVSVITQRGKLRGAGMITSENQSKEIKLEICNVSLH